MAWEPSHIRGGSIAKDIIQEMVDKITELETCNSQLRTSYEVLEMNYTNLLLLRQTWEGEEIQAKDSPEAKAFLEIQKLNIKFAEENKERVKSGLKPKKPYKYPPEQVWNMLRLHFEFGYERKVLEKLYRCKLYRLFKPLHITNKKITRRQDVRDIYVKYLAKKAHMIENQINEEDEE